MIEQQLRRLSQQFIGTRAALWQPVRPKQLTNLLRRLSSGHRPLTKSVEKFCDVVYEPMSELAKLVAMNFQRRFAIA